MQDPANELRRMHIPRTPVNKGKRKGRDLAAPALSWLYATSLFREDLYYVRPVVKYQTVCWLSALLASSLTPVVTTTLYLVFLASWVGESP